MKASKLFIIAILLGLSVSAKWAELPSPTSENLNTLTFVGNTGYCGGANGTLLKSTNGGNSWTEITSTTSDNITSLFFHDANNGYFTTSGGEVYKTTNGGSSWASKSLQSVGGLNGISFLNSSIGLAVGDNGFIFRTSNGGSSWDNLGNVSVFVVNDVVFVNDTLAVAVGAQGSVLSSSDAGQNWDWKGISSTNTFSAIEKKDDGTAMMVGTGGIYSEFSAANMTASNGSSIDPDGDWLKDIHLAPSGRTYTVGFAQSINMTNPGWKTWDLDSVNNLTSIQFVDDTIGIAVGANGKIYKTITGGFPVSSGKIEKVQLTLYPNPSSNNIRISNTIVSEAKIEIYNISGQLMRKEELNEELIDVSSLSPGLYFVRIREEHKIYTGRFQKK